MDGSVKKNDSVVGPFRHSLSRVGPCRGEYPPCAWIHEIVASCGEVTLTVSVFENTNGTNNLGQRLPEFESAYTLMRNQEVVFEDRVFLPEEAGEKTEYRCFPWRDEVAPYCHDPQDPCMDCDSDGEGDCHGFCAVAYRYTVIDNPPPVPEDEVDTEEPGRTLMYHMYTNPPFDVLPGSGSQGLGADYVYMSDQDDCPEKSDNCSVSAVGRSDAGIFDLITLLF